MARRKQDIEVTPRMPAGFLPISNPTLVAKPPEGAGWLHEIKFDGWRMQLHVAGGRPTWWTRRGHDWTEKLGVMSVFAGELPDCILDGEMCALDADGNPSFSALQSAMRSGRTDELVFFAFDILFRGETDLRPYALTTRKDALASVLEAGGEAIEDAFRFVEPLPATATAAQLKRAACAMRWEGIVSKKAGENYRPGRTEVWLKSKCRPGQEVVIGGWREGRDGRFKGVLTGVYDEGAFRYAGSIKNGFDARTAGEVRSRLKALARPRSPFVGPLQPSAEAGDRLHYAEPRLVAEAEIAEWTASGKMRQASFKGWREDKAPEEVRREG
jgi:bifunctional non-homologous end joining protein LigD